MVKLSYAVTYIILLLMVSFTTACSGTNSILTKMRVKTDNDDVYILPRKALVQPKVKDISQLQNLPKPEEASNDSEHFFVIKDNNSEALTQPPAEYQEPAPGAPVGDLGEDEKLKQLKKQKNPNIEPSKKSIWGN